MYYYGGGSFNSFPSCGCSNQWWFPSCGWGWGNNNNNYAIILVLSYTFSHCNWCKISHDKKGFPFFFFRFYVKI